MKYERLTDKRLAIPKNAFRQSKSKEEYLELSRVAYKTDNTEIYNRLAELEDKIEQGTLIELPCKVGDTVYKIEKDCHKCKHFKETGWEYDCWCDFDGEESKNMFEIDGDKDCLYTIKEIKFEFGTIPKFGKTVFLTREEAEKRLKELQE